MPEGPSSPTGYSTAARDLAEIPGVEVISRAAVMLLPAAAERLGLAHEDPAAGPHRDLDEARRLITAPAGLVIASAEYLGLHAGRCAPGSSHCRGVPRGLGGARRPGQGPGEKYTGPVG